MGQLLSLLPQDQSRSLLELISDITYKNTELIHLLRQQGEMNQILAELEEKIANHTFSWQQEHLIQEEMKGKLTMMCAAPPVYFTQLERILQHEKAIHQQVEQALQISEDLKARYYDLRENLQAFIVKSTEQLKEERKTSQLLMKQLDSSPSKIEANLVQNNQRLTESVAGREREKKLMQINIKELESALVGAEDRVSDYKKVSIRIHREMQLPLTHIKEKEKSIKTLKKELQDLEIPAAEISAQRNGFNIVKQGAY